MKYRIGCEWGLAVSALVFAAACGGTSADSDAEIGEAAAYLSTQDAEPSETPDLDEAMAGASDADADAIAEENASEVPDPEAASDTATCDFAALRNRVVANYDQDGDGALNAAERQAVRADLQDLSGDHPRFQRMLRRVRNQAWHAVRWVFDDNGDGVLDDAERAVLVETFEARCAVRRDAILEAFDADHDGTLNDDELAAFRADRRARLVAKRQEILDAYDANHNGTLEASERLAWKQDVLETVSARRQALRAEFDVDGDGTLNVEELAALKAAIREAIAAGDTIRPLA